KDGLKGARIGILRQAFETATTDSEVVTVFNKALDDLRKAGAAVVESRIDSLQQVLRGGGGCSRFKYDLETYFAARGEGAPVKTVDDIVRSRRFHPSVEVRLMNAQRDSSPPPSQQPGCRGREAMQQRFRDAVTLLMDSLKLDAL